MSQAQIDKALAAIEGFEPVGVPSIGSTPLEQSCLDENENDVCDAEEDDPVLTTCRKTYLNIIEKKARDDYGTRLGESAMRIAQTCSMAAAGGTLYYGHRSNAKSVAGGKAWYHDKDKLFEIGAYWDAVLSFSRYIFPSEAELSMDLNLEEMDNLIAGLPRDMRAMMKQAGGGVGPDDNVLYETALPIDERCENIRSYVGQSYRASVHHNTICLPASPEPDKVDDLDGEE